MSRADFFHLSFHSSMLCNMTVYALCFRHVECSWVLYFCTCIQQGKFKCSLNLTPVCASVSLLILLYSNAFYTALKRHVKAKTSVWTGFAFQYSYSTFRQMAARKEHALVLLAFFVLSYLTLIFLVMFYQLAQQSILLWKQCFWCFALCSQLSGALCVNTSVLFVYLNGLFAKIATKWILFPFWILWYIRTYVYVRMLQYVRRHYMH